VKDIFALRLYTRVARLGSFSAAARECGLSQSQASRIVADLEADLGTRLLSRSTRAVVPTEAGGESRLPQCGARRTAASSNTVAPQCTPETGVRSLAHPTKWARRRSSHAVLAM